MRLIPCFLLVLTLRAGDSSPVQRLWSELEAKRTALQSAHQEFEVTSTYTTAKGRQGSRRKVILDISRNLWREKTVSGSGSIVTVFDGDRISRVEEGGEEYVRVKPASKGETPAPVPYHVTDADWAKAQEVERRPCGIPNADHTCVLLRVPIKPSLRSAGADTSRIMEGARAFLLDLETGLLLSAQSAELIQNSRQSYTSEVSYVVTRIGLSGESGAGLFQVPAGLKEVKKLSAWNVARMKKQLIGNSAPEWIATDINGKPVSLADLKGKMVLIDFWTTWCPPCRKDAPALDKLFDKYGSGGLSIIGVSVSEERAVVEKFLREHPHSFPVVLTTENEMPRPFQISLFPTYVVVDKDGKVAGAAEGDQGFGELRRMLKKAGLEVD